MMRAVTIIISAIRIVIICVIVSINSSQSIVRRAVSVYHPINRLPVEHGLDPG